MVDAFEPAAYRRLPPGAGLPLIGAHTQLTEFIEMVGYDSPDDWPFNFPVRMDSDISESNRLPHACTQVQRDDPFLRASDSNASPMVAGVSALSSERMIIAISTLS